MGRSKVYIFNWTVEIDKGGVHVWLSRLEFNNILPVNPHEILSREFLSHSITLYLKYIVMLFCIFVHWGLRDFAYLALNFNHVIKYIYIYTVKNAFFEIDFNSMSF